MLVFANLIALLVVLNIALSCQDTIEVPFNNAQCILKLFVPFAVVIIARVAEHDVAIRASFEE
jgi:hypothetical protein